MVENVKLEPSWLILRFFPANNLTALPGLMVCAALVPDTVPLAAASEEIFQPCSIRLATENSWEPLIASVESAVTWPAATFLIWRSVPFEPTLIKCPAPFTVPAKPL